MGIFDDIITLWGESQGRSDQIRAQAGEAFLDFVSIPPKRTAPPPPNPGSFSENYARAFEQMKRNGITSDQAAAYRPINQFINRRIEPWGYRGGATAAESIPGDAESAIFPGPESDRKALERRYPGREDAWRMYLGMPQKYGTFSVSPYQPSTSSDKSAVYYRMNDFWQKRLAGLGSGDPGDVPDSTAMNIILGTEAGKEGRGQDSYMGVMGHYKIGSGKDERGPYMSYYDRWNLEGSDVEGSEGRFGKPFEIYDRLYYNPQSREIYWNGPPQVKK